MKYIITMSDVGRDIDDIIKGLKKPKVVKAKYSDWDMGFSKQAFNLITLDNPNHKKPNYESWANDCRKMRELDNRPKEEMIKLWQWVRQDEFWHSNVLSMSKFKSKYDQLLLKSGVSGNGQAKTSRSANKPSLIEQARTACSKFEQRSIRQDIEPLLVSDD